MAFTLPIGSKAPDFKPLIQMESSTACRTTSDYLVIFFTCNHCPYVQNSVMPAAQ